MVAGYTIDASSQFYRALYGGQKASRPVRQVSFFLPDLCVPLSFPIFSHPTHPSLPLSRRESVVADEYYHLCRGFHLVAAISNVVSGSARRLGEGGTAGKGGGSHQSRLLTSRSSSAWPACKACTLCACDYIEHGTPPCSWPALAFYHVPTSPDIFFSVFAWTRKKKAR